MKKFLLIIVAAAISLAASAGEKGEVFSKLNVEKFGIGSIWPSGLSAVTGSVWVELENGGEGFTVSQIKGTVYRDGAPFVNGSANNVYISKGKGKYTISGKASLCSGVSLLSLLRLFSFDPKAYSVDISVVVTSDSGVSQTLSVEKFPVSALLNVK